MFLEGEKQNEKKLLCHLNHFNVVRLYKCLREYFAPSQPFEKLSHLESALSQFVHFLSIFHCDSRVVNNGKHNVTSSDVDVTILQLIICLSLRA